MKQRNKFLTALTIAVVCTSSAQANYAVNSIIGYGLGDNTPTFHGAMGDKDTVQLERLSVLAEQNMPTDIYIPCLPAPQASSGLPIHAPETCFKRDVKPPTPPVHTSDAQKPKNWWDFINSNNTEDAEGADKAELLPLFPSNLASGGGAYIWRDGKFVKVGMLPKPATPTTSSELAVNSSTDKPEESKDIGEYIWYYDKHGNWVWGKVGSVSQSTDETISAKAKRPTPVGQPNPMPDTQKGTTIV